MAVSHPTKVELKEFETINGKAVLAVGALHVYQLDDIAYHTLSVCDGRGREEIISQMSEIYVRDEVEETLSQLEGAKLIIDRDLKYPIFKPPNKHPISILVLHIVRSCNLRCRYCYSGKGDYGMGIQFMNEEVARASLDFLMRYSEGLEKVEIVFFGGEPLLNLKLIKYIVEDCVDIPEKYGKKISFSMTTNGTLLDDDVIEYLNKKKIRVMISMDGDKETHDKMRVFPDGSGSYDVMLPKVKNFLKSRNGRVSARATFTRYNLNLLGILKHLIGFGFGRVYLSGCWMDGSRDYELREEDIPRIEEEWGRGNRVSAR